MYSVPYYGYAIREQQKMKKVHAAFFLKQVRLMKLMNRWSFEEDKVRSIPYSAIVVGGKIFLLDFFFYQ